MNEDSEDRYKYPVALLNGLSGLNGLAPLSNILFAILSISSLCKT